MQYLKLVIAFGVVLAAWSLCGAEHRAYTSKHLELHSLQKCSLRKAWIGLWPRFPEGVVLECANIEFVVLQQNNLLGHVHIVTPEDALEYARLFTSPETFKFFDMNGMVELVEGNSRSPDAAFNVIAPSVFRKHFRRARVIEVNDRPCKEDLAFACGKEFRITRVVVLADQHIYEVTESVYESGFYSLISKHLLFKDASRVGVLHLGDL